MNEIAKYLLGVVVLAALAKLLTFVKPYKVALIKRAVSAAETKYAVAEKAGKQKKAFALNLLRWGLIQANDTTSDIIDAVVSVANDKDVEMTSALKSVTTSEVSLKLDEIKNSVTKG